MAEQPPIGEGIAVVDALTIQLPSTPTISERDDSNGSPEKTKVELVKAKLDKIQAIKQFREDVSQECDRVVQVLEESIFDELRNFEVTSDDAGARELFEAGSRLGEIAGMLRWGTADFVKFYRIECTGADAYNIKEFMANFDNSKFKIVLSEYLNHGHRIAIRARGIYHYLRLRNREDIKKGRVVSIDIEPKTDEDKRLRGMADIFAAGLLTNNSYSSLGYPEVYDDLAKQIVERTQE